jgi:putative sterol carrier protein
MERSLDNLALQLERRFRADQSAGVDMRLRIDTGEGRIDFHIERGTLTLSPPTAATPDVTFLFHDLATAWRILLGEANAIEAFMQGRFRADGYLMMAFRLMEMFGSASLPPTPND